MSSKKRAELQHWNWRQLNPFSPHLQEGLGGGGGGGGLTSQKSEEPIRLGEPCEMGSRDKNYLGVDGEYHAGAFNSCNLFPSARSFILAAAGDRLYLRVGYSATYMMTTSFFQKFNSANDEGLIHC